MMTPALATAYALLKIGGTFPAREDVLMIDAGFPNISGIKARETRNTLKRLTSTVRIQAASS
jgi:hypothetical protein